MPDLAQKQRIDQAARLGDRAVRGGYDEHLPIYDKRQDLLSAIRDNQVVVVAGETGSGKTTQLPLICLEAGRGHRGIACTQPRRIAATSIARYVSDRLNVKLGTEVGYRIRFDQSVSHDTSVTFMTDGTLLTDIQGDRHLHRYDTIIIDEAHERSINIDFLLGFLRQLLPTRPDLKLIISSATIDTDLFSRAFDNAPIVEVSGRLFPVDIIYQPLELDEDGVAEHYIEAAVRTTADLLEMPDQGDILVFMPTQQDISETVDALKDLRLPGQPFILPLYGRLPAGEQNRIFAQRHKRAVIVATNIAETSITVPGIRYVVDTGLARTVRYVPHLRTSRMPVEPVSKASADQRSGRCGRVRDGICIRLYSEEGYQARTEFTEPEIRRTNLAGVVLQMHSLRLGDMETFPFLEPPDRRAILDGYGLLTDLGALTKERTLTGIGRRMAKLPLDPHVARMVLQADHEDAVREVAIIAAALSIVDPRERPAEKRTEADNAQRRFSDPMSDFLAFLKLWETYQSEWETLRTQNRMRRFCREHFLSYNRMREWHDVHTQIRETSRRGARVRENRKPATYDAIHRSLLAGLIHNVAMLREKGEYRATRDRTIRIFPGSSLFRKAHPWVMCHEIVETTRVYARTAAVIQPEWIEQLAPELCRQNYAEPRFDETNGTVRATESVTFFGLPIVKGRTVHYGRIDPETANRIFVLNGLVEGRLRTRHPFLRHNLRMQDEVAHLEAKLRTRSLYIGDDAVAQWYTSRIPRVTSIHDLNRSIKEQGDDRFLRLAIEDLLTVDYMPQADLPETFDIGKKRYELTYRFAPGQPEDGISVRIPAKDIAGIHAHAFEWAVPQLWAERVGSLLSHLPRQLRKRFVPLPESATRIASRLTYSARPFVEEVRKTISQLYRIELPRDVFDSYEPDPSLWVRVIVVDRDGKESYSYIPPHQPPQRREAVRYSATHADQTFSKWVREGLTEWDFDELPERVQATPAEGALPVFGFPALEAADGHVSVTVSSDPETAKKVHAGGVRRLAELALASDLAWEDRDAAVDPKTAIALAPYARKQALNERARALLHSFVSSTIDPTVRTRQSFLCELERIRRELRGMGMRISNLFATIASEYNSAHSLLQTRSRRAVGTTTTLVTELRTELSRYLRDAVGGGVPLTLLEHYPRYLMAFAKRIEIAFTDPVKYRQRKQLLSRFEQRLAALNRKRRAATETVRLRELLEEYAVSLYAQQSVKARLPVSEKRLDQEFSRSENAGG